MSNIKEQSITYIDNPIAQNGRSKYTDVTVNVEEVLQSWRVSVYSYEWLSPDGGIKEIHNLKDNDRQRREAVETSIKSNTPLEKPILGIGLLDNIEIGSGRAVFLTLASMGIKEIQVHIPTSQTDEFENFTAP